MSKSETEVPLCPTCGEPFFPGQKYFAAPIKVHVMCQKYKEEFMLACALMYERWLRNEKDKANES